MNITNYNKKYLLNFISDIDFDEVVTELFNKAIIANSQMTEKKFHKQVIDPLSTLIEISAFDLTYDEWKDSETRRQIQKTLNNSIGNFHQRILGKVKGWTDAGVGKGVDLINEEKKIIAEIKNKHNTVTKGKETGVYNELEDLVMPKSSKYKGFTSYYVKIIPQKPERYNKCFRPSDKTVGKLKPENDLIREIDGYSFYDLVTDEKDAYQKIFSKIPISIKNNFNFDNSYLASINMLFEKAYGNSEDKLF